MKSFWFYVYNIVVFPLLIVIARGASIFNRKLRDGFRDRVQLFDTLESSMAQTGSKTPRVWFHVSSLGEFEQAKPIIQTVKTNYPDGTVIVTFFSPSGYRHSKNYKFADIISYIPVDSRRLARKFIDLVKPDAAIFIRYDIWPNHIWALAESGIPRILSSATMREKSIRLNPLLRSFHRHLFNIFTVILTITDYDVRQFKRFGLSEPLIEEAGDTRYDQVLERSKAAQKTELLPDGITRRKKVLVIGSSWLEDEEHLIPALKNLYNDEKTLFTILAPHEPNEQNLERIEKQLGSEIPNIRFSHLNSFNNEKLIIVDSVGILVTLYKYAHVAFIGGGFKTKVHNVLEAAVYGIPVVFGPHHANSQEAVELARRKGGFVVTDRQSLQAILQRLFSDTQFRKQTGAVCRQLVKENAGATNRIMRHLKKSIR